MLKFVGKRIVTAIIILLVSMFAVFTILTYIPGSRLGYMSIAGNGDLLDRLFEVLKVQPSLLSRYLRYVYDVFVHFHFSSGFRHQTTKRR